MVLMALYNLYIDATVDMLGPALIVFALVILIGTIFNET